jgi:hypothetical protein
MALVNQHHTFPSSLLSEASPNNGGSPDPSQQPCPRVHYLFCTSHKSNVPNLSGMNIDANACIYTMLKKGTLLDSLVYRQMLNKYYLRKY